MKTHFWFQHLGISDLLYLTCNVTKDFGFQGLIHMPLNFHFNPEQQLHIELELLCMKPWSCLDKLLSPPTQIEHLSDSIMVPVMRSV